jgi:hypothetical protein
MPIPILKLAATLVATVQGDLTDTDWSQLLQISGYADTVPQMHAQPEPPYAFLQKPRSLGQLAASIRRLLPGRTTVT